jgi:hypothetical protein
LDERLAVHGPPEGQRFGIGEVRSIALGSGVDLIQLSHRQLFWCELAAIELDAGRHPIFGGGTQDGADDAGVDRQVAQHVNH